MGGSAIDWTTGYAILTVMPLHLNSYSTMICLQSGQNAVLVSHQTYVLRTLSGWAECVMPDL